MSYLLWSILNAVLLLYFFYLIIGFFIIGKKVFQGRMMPLSVTVLVLGVMHIGWAAFPEKENPEIIIAEENSTERATESKRILLEDNLTFDIELAVTYAVEGGKLVPLENHSGLYGLNLGYDWKLHSLDLQPDHSNGQTTYSAVGTLDWSLFGANIYTQEKRFQGSF